MPLPLALDDAFRGQLHTARELARKTADEEADGRFRTSVEALDGLLEGGLRRGTMVELIGRLSSGRFSLVLATLAAVTGLGEPAALVDLGDALDPQAAEDAGVDLRRLLWVRPRTIKETLASAEAILACGMPMLAIDLGLPPLAGGRGAEAGWLRLARAARAHRAALLIASPYRASGTAADVVLHAQGRRAAWGDRHAAGDRPPPTLLRGIAARLDLRKRRGGRPGAHRRYAFTVPAAVAGSDAAWQPRPQPRPGGAVVSLADHPARRPARRPAHRQRG